MGLDTAGGQCRQTTQEGFTAAPLTALVKKPSVCGRAFRIKDLPCTWITADQVITAVVLETEPPPGEDYPLHVAVVELSHN